MSSPNSDEGLTPRAVFLSYAREDSAAAQRIAGALRSQGAEVWFDQSELRGGDVWDQKIRRQIKECAIFMPIISERTQARGEGYFRLEWKLAVERTHLMAEGVPFLAPVVVDATSEGAAIVPAEFLRVQWLRLPGSLPTPQFVEQVKGMLAAPRIASAPFSAAYSAGAPRPQRRAWAVGALVVVVVAVAFALVVSRRTPPAPPAEAGAAGPAVDPRSIAVLPFENMSEDKQNAFFTDGVHEDVLTNLSFIRDLNLVSRTSVMQYRGTTKSIKQIGRELGVAYVLEGSVRREGTKVRVTGQLIDARSDKHLWAKSYDRDVTDIFAIQGELARAIADALQAVLSPEAKVLLARRPTENSVAYDDYLKARQIRFGANFGSTEKAVALLEDAVRLDPRFAPAWAELASLRALSYFKFEHGEQEIGPAKEAIDTAVRLAPDDPAVIEAVGDYYYYGSRDYTRATEQYLRLAQMRPNDPVMYYSLGLIQRRQGRMADAIPNLRRGLKLDPANEQYILEFASSLDAVRRYDEAESMLRKLMDVHPDDSGAEFLLCMTTFWARGSTAEMKAAVRRAADPSDHSLNLYAQSNFALARGDFAEFAKLNREQRYYDGNPDDPRWNQDVTAAESFAESGDMAAARARASEALVLMRAEIARQPDNSVLWAALSLANALLGKKDDALRSAQRSGELMPESRDAIVGPGNSNTCALAFAWIGDKGRALAELERLLHVPWGMNIYASRAGWRPLRDDPRFKKLVSDPANNAPLL
ncbi:MAG TPA: TIR domain-containing protein [Opitutaceae bacterium]|nr:TIR domain-containing protein [Opitutaceae bacterium]